MKKKYYNCFSYNQMIYLRGKGVMPIAVKMHYKTSKSFWIFVMTEELDKFLVEWSKRTNNRKVRDD